MAKVVKVIKVIFWSSNVICLMIILLFILNLPNSLSKASTIAEALLGAYYFLHAFTTVPLTYKFIIVPNIERRLREKLIFKGIFYDMTPFPYLLMPSVELSMYIAWQCMLRKVSTYKWWRWVKKIVGSRMENTKLAKYMKRNIAYTKELFTLGRVNYHIEEASFFEKILSVIMCIGMATLLTCGGIILWNK